MSDKSIKQTGLEFVCPKCKNNKLESCEQGIFASEITNIDADGDFEFGPIIADDAEVDHFGCVDCGYNLEDKEGNRITEHGEVVEWIKENC